MTDERKPIVRGPNEGQKIYAAGDLYRFLAVESETDGAYGLWETIVPPGGGPPPHLHRNEEEGFYVIEGRVTVYSDDGEVEAVPGSFVHLPKHTKHWFRNNSDTDAKMLILVAPGGMEGMFLETGTPVGAADESIPEGHADEKQKLLNVAPKYGIEIHFPE